MKQVFLRGLLTGIVAGFGFDLFMGVITDWAMTPAQWLGGLVGGALFGLLLGLTMMLLLLFLRLLDRRTGWQLAKLLEHSEPGPAGLLAGLLLTFPAATVGGVGFGIATFNLLQYLYFHYPSDWGFMLTAFTGILVLPFTVLAGLSLGAVSGAAVGSGIIGLIRGMWSRGQ